MKQIENSILAATIIFALGILFTSCSEGLLSTASGGVQIDVAEETFTVHNKFSEPIHYFAVEAGTAAYISWAPISSDDIKINPKSKKVIAFSDVYRYEKGDRILFYNWTGDEPESDEIAHKSIETD